MGLFQQFALGIRTYLSAWNFIFKYRLSWFFIFPILLNILLLWGGFTAFGSLAEQVQDWFIGKYDFSAREFWMHEHLNSVLSWLIFFLLELIFFFIFAYIGGFIVIIILSPVFAWLSEKVEQKITGVENPFDVAQFLRDILRGIALALRNLAIEIGFMVFLFFAGFLPVIGIVAPVALFFISSYFYGFSFMDYTNERHRLTVRKSVELIRHNKGVATANGVVFSFFLLIPFCGASLAGFAAILSVVAATLSMLDSKWHQHNSL